MNFMSKDKKYKKESGWGLIKQCQNKSGKKFDIDN